MKKGKRKKLMLILLGSVILASPTSARELFGTANVDSGFMTVIRSDGATTVTGQKTAEIQKNDLLMAGSNSAITWQVDEDLSLQMGSNCILTPTTWKRAGGAGYLSLVYGIVKTHVKEGGERTESVLKTPTATIRFTKSLRAEVASTGSTLISVLSGKATISNQQGSMKSIESGQIALVINGEIVVPEKEKIGQLQPPLDNSVMNTVALTWPKASSLSAEAALLAAGILNEDMLVLSKRIDVSVDESFDVVSDPKTASAMKQLGKQTISDDLEDDLDAMDDLDSIEIDSETDQFGVVRIKAERPEKVFIAFETPKVPGDYFDLDDQTSWVQESGVIALTIEK